MNYEGVNMITCGGGNCFILRGGRGDILIDTCKADYRAEIAAWLQNYDIKLIVLTHGHNDHIQNAAYFAKLYGADVAMCAYDMKLSRNNMLHGLYPIGLQGKALLKASEKLFLQTADPFEITVFLDDGMELGAELDIECEAISLPGHTKGSFGIMHNRDLYLGDAAMNFLYPSFPAICESPKDARKSLEKIKLLRPKRLFFGHGRPVEAGTREYRNLLGIY